MSKIEGGLQELEETGYWLELLEDSGIARTERVATLRSEARELNAILTACVKNVKQRRS